MAFDENEIRTALRASWSRDTAVQWTRDNPALGQCNVTAAVIHDLFGGRILRTKLRGIWHYYNEIEGRRIDLTDSQFTSPGALFDAPEIYQDEVSSCEDTMNGIPEREYDTLKTALVRDLGN